MTAPVPTVKASRSEGYRVDVVQINTDAVRSSSHVSSTHRQQVRFGLANGRKTLFLRSVCRRPLEIKDK